jgi:putative FmdB family regulatory protein
MPNYRYRAVEPAECETCTPGFEVLQRLSDEPISICPECEAPVRRVIGKTNYVTHQRWNTKKMLSDGNLKRLGFKKMVKESDGKYVDVLQD